METISKFPLCTHKCKQNLHKGEKGALQRLKNDNSIILKETNKGGGDSNHGHRLLQRKKILEILTDQAYYKEESKHPDKTTLDKIRILINEYQDSFTDNKKNYLCTSIIKESNFYGLLKIT